jgi:hypothetical protein
VDSAESRYRTRFIGTDDDPTRLGGGICIILSALLPPSACPAALFTLSLEGSFEGHLAGVSFSNLTFPTRTHVLPILYRRPLF